MMNYDYVSQHNHSYFSNKKALIKRHNVFLSTLQILAIFRLDIPSFKSSVIRFLLGYNLYFDSSDFLPIGRPKVTPSAFSSQVLLLFFG